MFMTDYTPGNSARTLPSAATLPVGTSQALGSEEFAGSPSSGLFGKPRGSGLFGQPRVPPISQFGKTGGPASVNIRQDPFMTHGVGPADGYNPYSTQYNGYNEQSPLQPGADDIKPDESSKGMIVPTSLLMLLVTVASGVALAASFSETGYRDGYEEGHLDGVHQQSGCQSLFYWLVLQFCLDLVITCFTCLVLQGSPSFMDTVSFLGCIACIRLCAMAAGFHILYSSGLQREFCNPLLITWSTILTWLGISVMAVVGFYLLLVLLGVCGGLRKRQALSEKLSNQ